jgi:hypothetical protein
MTPPTSQSDDRLRVFISSRMQLIDLRAALRRELQRLKLAPYVFEASQGSTPDDAETASLRAVEQSDILVLILDGSWGEITEREYDKARDLGKPCFVYERLARSDAAADPEFIRFLKKLSGPKGVPTRTTFQDVVDLAEKVADNVQTWLTQQYRRLSAAQAEAGPSHRASQLADDMKRLAATTSQPLERGNSSDLLAWQLRQWFEALGHTLEKEPQIGEGHTDLVIRVPARRGRYTVTLVRAKDRAIEAADVERAAEALAPPIEEVWLVTFRRVSPAAKKEAEKCPGILVYTLDELIEEDTNFETYFDWLDGEVRNSKIDQLYVPLAVTVNEVDSAGAIRAKSTYENVAHYVDQWLQDPDREHLSLLGEFGTGKSWFALKYAHDMVEEYRRAKTRGLQRPRLPLVIRLREYARGFKDVGALLTEFVFREHEIQIHSVRALESLNRMGRLLFIFDGFDEMAAKVDQQKMVDNFWSLASILGPGSKAILTCRSEYFQFAQQARDVLGGKLRGSILTEAFGKTRFQVATLEMFDNERLRNALTLRSGDAAVIEKVLADPTLADLARRPVMIELLLEAMPALKTETVDLAQVYYEAVKRKMERDIGSKRTFTSMADKMFFLCEISWEMLSTGQLKINYREIPARIQVYFGLTNAAEEDHYRHDLLSQTMLVRDDEGYYHPAHKSLVEFFSAYRLAAAVGALQDRYLGVMRANPKVDEKLSPAGQTWSAYFRGTSSRVAPLARFVKGDAEHLAGTWGKLALNDSIKQMLFLLGGRDGLVAAVRELNGPDEGVIAGRVLMTAAFSLDLRGVNLGNTSVMDCSLSRCNLDGSNCRGLSWTKGRLYELSLQGADFRGARFANVDFRNIDFRGAGLLESTFADCSLASWVESAHWGENQTGETLVAMSYDGRIFAIEPRKKRVTEPQPGIRAGRLRYPRSSAQHEELGEIVVSGHGWKHSSYWISDLQLDADVQAEFATRSAGGGDVEVLDLTLRNRQTGSVILSANIFDASGLERGGTRLLAISRSGRKLATVSGTRGGSEGANLRFAGELRQPPLQHFRGVTFDIGPETIDTRGAAFSPSESIIAICERPDTIGFWQTETGELIGRVMFVPATEGCIVDGATGLPEWFTPSNPGWIWEGPSQA